jgi:hypothetical protein
MNFMKAVGIKAIVLASPTSAEESIFKMAIIQSVSQPIFDQVTTTISHQQQQIERAHMFLVVLSSPRSAAHTNTTYY